MKVPEESKTWDDKEKPFLSTLNKAINYFNQPKTCFSKEIIFEPQYLTQKVLSTDPSSTKGVKETWGKHMYEKVLKTETEGTDPFSILDFQKDSMDEDLKDDLLQDSLNKEPDEGAQIVETAKSAPKTYKQDPRDLNNYTKFAEGSSKIKSEAARVIQSNGAYSRIKQLEKEVLRLNKIVKKEKKKNQDLTNLVKYYECFGPLYKQKLEQDDPQAVFSKMIGGL